MKTKITSIISTVLLLIPQVSRATDISGVITGNTTLTLAGSPYRVTGNITVNAGVTLTIQPGVTVRFSQNCGLWIEGALQVPGTATAPVTITGTTEQDGWWRGIIIENAGSGNIQHAVVACAGYYENANILKTGGGPLSITDSTLRNCTGDGLRITGDYSTFTSARNNFSHNNYGVRVGLNASFNDNTSQFSSNNINVYIVGGTITRSTTWNLNPAYSLYVSGNMTVDVARLLKIMPGTVVKFGQNCGIWVDGQFDASGTSSSPIRFTDWRDDSVGGDANMDGVTTAASPGWWRAITIESAGTATFQYATLSYSGYYDSSGILKTGSGALNITNSTVFNIAGNGLRVQDSTGATTLGNSAFSANSQSGLRLINAGPVSATSCSFTGNSSCGVMQDINDTLDYGGNTFTGNSLAGVGLNGGTRGSNMTLKTAGSPFLILGNTTVDVAASLTVQPGTTVAFNQNCGLWIEGALLVAGTATAPVTFTGSTEQDGWWRGIIIENAGSGNIQHADIAYAGYYENANILKTGGGPLSVTDSTLRNCTGDGLRITGDYSTFTSARNNFSHNNYGVRVGLNASFNDNTSQFLSNNINVYIVGGTITRSTTWNLNPAYSLYVSGSMTVDVTRVLKIMPGTVVKFGQNCGIWVDGQLNATGTTTARVLFTDWRDDSVGGDANMDATATSPAPGWWRGIIIKNAGTASIQYATLSYSGYYDSCGILKYGTGTLAISNSSVLNIIGDGLRVQDSSGATSLSSSTFTTCTQSGMRLINAGPVSAVTCSFIKNTAYGVLQDINDTLDYAGNTFTGNPVAAVGVYGGTRNSSMTLKPAGSPFLVLGNTTIAASATLTVQPGTTVKFSQNCGIWLDGALQATGISTSRVNFTGSTAQNGWWRGIVIQNAGSATLGFATISYAGYWENANIVKSGTGSLSLTDSTITHCSGDGLRVASGYSAFTSARNIYSYNNYGVRVGLDCSFNDNTSKFYGNKLNAYIDGGTLSKNVTWNLNRSYSMYVSGNTSINPGLVLKIMPGTVVKFAQNCGIWVDGQLDATGTAALPIQFTDWRNDSVGGDANMDAAATAAAPGWWRGIIVEGAGSATFQNAVLSYSGYYDSVGILKTGTGNLFMRKSTVRYTAGDGLRVTGDTGTLDVFQNGFSSNTNGVKVLNQTKAVVLSGNLIATNSGYGLINQNSTTVDARNNWWGSATGPLHDTLNPGGLGNKVSDGVLFKPWWGSYNRPEIVVLGPSGANLTDGVSSFVFGQVVVSTPLVKTFTIKNTGTGDLLNLAVSITGTNPGNFTVSAPGATTLPPGSQTTFTVTFRPSATGLRSAVFHIASNDADENPFDVNLSGTGLAQQPVLATTASSGTTTSTGKTSTASALLCDSTTVALQSVTSVVQVDGSKYLSLVVMKPEDGSNPKITVEVSPNLVDWFSGSNHTTLMADTPSFIQVRDNTPVVTGVKRYIRVK